MPSHTRGRWRTRCPVHTRSSPSWTCSRGRNRTQVRKTLAPPSPLRFHGSASLSDLTCGPVPRIHSGFWLLCDSVVVYQCQMGFRLWGSPRASCDPVSQQWSRPPTCRGTGGGPTVALNPDYLAPIWISPAADINECEEQTSVCPENLECVNVPGSFSCSGLFDPSI